MKQTAVCCIFLQIESNMRSRLRRREDRAGRKIDRSPTSPLSSFLPLICTILLFRSPRVAEERRATARGLIMKETYVVLTCYKAQHPGPIAHQVICAVYVDRHIWFHSSSSKDSSTPVMRTYMFRFRYLTLATRKTGRSFILSYHTLALV